MIKSEKLNLLEQLIARAGAATYDSRNEMNRCIDDSNTFIRNVMPYSPWIERINNIRWSLSIVSVGTPEHAYVKAWENEKLDKAVLLFNYKDGEQLVDLAEATSIASARAAAVLTAESLAKVTVALAKRSVVVSALRI